MRGPVVHGPEWPPLDCYTRGGGSFQAAAINGRSTWLGTGRWVCGAGAEYTHRHTQTRTPIRCNWNIGWWWSVAVGTKRCVQSSVVVFFSVLFCSSAHEFFFLPFYSNQILTTSTHAQRNSLSRVSRLTFLRLDNIYFFTAVSTVVYDFNCKGVGSASFLSTYHWTTHWFWAK